jgi:predicted small lipoprotein YifL
MAARPRRRRALILLAGAAALGGCGHQGPDYSLRTPPDVVVARPIETPDAPAAKGTPEASQPHPTKRQAERLRPVLAAWAAAVRRGDAAGAARFFAVPAIVSQDMAVQLQTREQVRRFNAELPCGEQLLGVHPQGRYIVGTFRLTDRPGQPCTDVGRLSRVAFVFRARRFTEWRQIPDRPNAPPGPPEPEPAPPPGGPGPA